MTCHAGLSLRGDCSVRPTPPPVTAPTGGGFSRRRESVRNHNVSSSSSSSSGIGFVGLLTILFIGLKLTGYIAWSWWWVLSPIWISFTVVVLIFFVAFGVITWLAR